MTPYGNNILFWLFITLFSVINELMCFCRLFCHKEAQNQTPARMTVSSKHQLPLPKSLSLSPSPLSRTKTLSLHWNVEKSTRRWEFDSTYFLKCVCHIWSVSYRIYIYFFFIAMYEYGSFQCETLLVKLALRVAHWVEYCTEICFVYIVFTAVHCRPAC